MKTALWLALVCIPSLLAIIIIAAALVYAAPPGSWQLAWSWNKSDGHNDDGQFFNGTLTGSPSAFTFSGDGATCSGGGVVGGVAMTMNCSGPGWTAQANGLLTKRPVGFVFSGIGFGMRDGNATSANWVTLQVTG